MTYRYAADPMLYHNIFVKSGTIDNYNETIRLLDFIANNLAHLKKLNIKFSIQKFKESDLDSDYVSNLLKSKKVNKFNLPALVTKNKVYYGVDDIIETYDRTIRHHRSRPKQKFQGKGDIRSGSIEKKVNNENFIHDYINAELRNDIRNKRDDNEDFLGNEGDMSEAVARAQQEIQRRGEERGSGKMNSIQKMVQDIRRGNSMTDDYDDDYDNNYDNRNFGGSSNDDVLFDRKNEEPTDMQSNFETDNVHTMLDPNNLDDRLLDKFFSNQETTTPY
jgi:hypothetical protein